MLQYLPLSRSFHVIVVSFLLFSTERANGLATTNNIMFTPKGTAATPSAKKKIAVAGVGGYAGAVTFGFLQRAASLYGTGVGAVRAIGATADSATRLNRVLSKHFCLAFADESYIKLCSLMNAADDENNGIAAKLQGWDALILGTDVGITQRTVTPGTYEKTPNDRTMELYWPAPGNIYVAEEEVEMRRNMLSNLLRGAQKAGVQHICFVDDAAAKQDGSGEASIIWQALQETGVPYTCLRPTGPLTTRPDYTYRTGVMNELTVTKVGQQKMVSTPTPLQQPEIYREDLAALAVQSLLTLDWTQSRCLTVSSSGSSPSADALAAGPRKRPDQEWCVHSFLLQQALAAAEDVLV